MNLFNRDTDYAVRALVYMGQRSGEMLSVADIHAELGIPRPHLRGILQKLARGGVLLSRRGPRGGFQLNKRPETIPLTDVLELFQGEVNFSHCLFHGEACPNRVVCALRATIKEIEAMVEFKLRSTTIATLGGSPQKRVRKGFHSPRRKGKMGA